MRTFNNLDILPLNRFEELVGLDKLKGTEEYNQRARDLRYNSWEFTDLNYHRATGSVILTIFIKNQFIHFKLGDFARLRLVTQKTVKGSQLSDNGFSCPTGRGSGLDEHLLCYNRNRAYDKNGSFQLFLLRIDDLNEIELAKSDKSSMFFVLGGKTNQQVLLPDTRVLVLSSSTLSVFIYHFKRGLMIYKQPLSLMSDDGFLRHFGNLLAFRDSKRRCLSIGKIIEGEREVRKIEKFKTIFFSDYFEKDAKMIMRSD